MSTSGPTSGRLWGCAAIWALLLTSWLPAELALAPGDERLSNADLPGLACLVGAALAWTVLWGALLARRRAWALLGLSVLASTELLLGCFVLAIVLAPPQPDSGDGPPSMHDMIANGVAVLAVPTALLMVVLLGAGALVGLATRAVGARLRARAVE